MATTKKFQCDECDRTFDHPQGLALHQRWAHSRSGKIKMMRAARIGVETRLGNRATRRQAKLTKKPAIEEFQCKFCPRKFASDSGIRYHLKAVHGAGGSGQTGATCSECGYESTPAGVALHQSLAHGKRGEFTKKHECSYCDFSCRSKETLDRHMKSKHPGETGLVEMRGKELYSSTEQHTTEQHTSIRFCPVCGENILKWRKENE